MPWLPIQTQHGKLQHKHFKLLNNFWPHYFIWLTLVKAIPRSPKYGSYVFHESQLPYGRGTSVSSDRKKMFIPLQTSERPASRSLEASQAIQAVSNHLQYAACYRKRQEWPSTAGGHPGTGRRGLAGTLGMRKETEKRKFHKWECHKEEREMQNTSRKSGFLVLFEYNRWAVFGTVLLTVTIPSFTAIKGHLGTYFAAKESQVEAQICWKAISLLS